MKVFVRSTAPLLTILAVIVGLTSAQADAAERRSKLDKVLQAAALGTPTPQRVIVRTRPGTRAAVKKSLQTHGDVVVAEHPSLDALTVIVHGEDLRALDANSEVLSVSADAEVTSFAGERKAAGNSSKRDEGRTDLLRVSLGLDHASPYRGDGIGVAIVDSGIEPTRDLASSLAGFWDFTLGNGVPTIAYDDYGHGTHVAGLIASDGVESHRQFAGVAPNVRLFGLKVLDRNGRGRVSTVLRALEWIRANHRAKGIHVVNLSLGHPIYQDAAHDPLVLAVEDLVEAGLVVVVAAGNAGVDENGEPGYTGITSPGNAPSALTVGAADTRGTTIHSDDRVAFFSSRGPSWYDGFAKPDVVAPGVGLTSNAAKFASLFKSYPQFRSQLGAGLGRGSFATLSGTSMATAVATGVVALMLDADGDATANAPRVSPNAVKALLQYSALPLRDDRGVLYDALTQGTGKINPSGALAMIEALDTSVPVGAPWIVARPEGVTTLGGEQVEWARNITWDDTLVSNPAAIWINSAQWGQCDPANPDCENIVWGTGFACDPADSSCENIVWGTSDTENVVWGSAAAWTGNLVWSDRILGMFLDHENIVWGTLAGLTEENIVWGTFDGENIVWGTFDGENIVWGTFDGENIVWGTVGFNGENIVWGTALVAYRR